MAITPSTPGYTSYGGRTACTCLAQWLPVFEADLQRRGLIDGDLDVTQLTGKAAASAGTHAEGGTFDIWQAGPGITRIAREMGAAAFDRKPPAFDRRHTHGVLEGCPHNTPARYQITALALGFNGLGKGGMGGRDDEPGPRQLRTWREGIEWAKARHDAAPTPGTTPTEEDDMYSDDDRKRDQATHDRVLTLMGAVEKLHTLVRGIADVVRNMSRWVGYLMPAVERQGVSLTALANQVDEALAATSDPALVARLKVIRTELDDAIKAASR